MIIRTDSKEEKEIRQIDAANGQVVQDYVDGLAGKKPVAWADIPDLTPQQFQRLPYVMAAQRPCFLHLATTGEEVAPEVVSTWRIPDDLAQGRVDRTVFYSLCRRCMTLIGVRDEIGKLFRESLQNRKPKEPLIKVEG